VTLKFPISDPPLTDQLVGAVLYELGRAVRDEKGCLIWQGSTAGTEKRGCIVIYLSRERVNGKEHVRRRVYLASRLVRRMFAEDLTPMDLARHTCDEPRCCDWLHIIPGTPRQNTQDCLSRGRGNRKRILTDEHIAEAIRLRAQGVTFPAIAAPIGVHWTTIQAALRRRSALAVQP